jgi:hypothetical protein
MYDFQALAEYFHFSGSVLASYAVAASIEVGDDLDRRGSYLSYGTAGETCRVGVTFS